MLLDELTSSPMPSESSPLAPNAQLSPAVV